VVVGVDNFLGKMGWSFPDGSPLTFANPLKVLKDQQFHRLPTGVEVLVVDQSERPELLAAAEYLVAKFGPQSMDLVVDDGSHLMRDQQQTLALFWPLLRPGGCFVMEDVHSSKQSGYDVAQLDGQEHLSNTESLSNPNGDSKTTKNTVKPRRKNDWWSLLEGYRATGAIESFYMTEDEARYLTRTLQEVRCYVLKEAESETCVLVKGGDRLRTGADDGRGDQTVGGAAQEHGDSSSAPIRVIQGIEVGITSSISY
jgi:hypothetical protein